MMRKRESTDDQFRRWINGRSLAQSSRHSAIEVPLHTREIPMAGVLSDAIQQAKRPPRPRRGVVLPADMEKESLQSLMEITRGAARTLAGRAGRYVHKRSLHRVTDPKSLDVVEASGFDPSFGMEERRA